MKVLEMFGEPILNGGQESFVVNVLRHMDMNGLQVDLLTPYFCDNTYYTDLITQKGGAIYSFGLEFNPGKSRNNIFKPLNDFLRKNKYDVIHIHSGSISVLSMAALCAKKNAIKKIIVHSHSTAERKTWKYRMVKMLSTPILGTCPSNYCACSMAAGKWKFSSRVAKKKLIILKNGVNLTMFSFDQDMRNQMRKELNVGEDEFVVGHVGRFSNEKNHKFLIDIFEAVKNVKPEAKLLLLGEGDTKKEIEELIKTKHMQEYVVFLGNVTNVYDYMQCMDVFALPSLYEGLPIVGIEAQAAGIPMVVSQNVPKELNLTNTIEFLALSDSKENWARVILKNEGLPRNQNSELLKKKGYDIYDTAAKMKKLYM